MKTKNNGFTILEIMVSISLFVIIMILTGSIYSLAQKSYLAGSVAGELVQNARVSLDRISRELRQSENIITALPAVADDPLSPPADEILFQNGHEANRITYILYYLDDVDLKRKETAYYFEEEPENYVYWNSLNQYGSPAVELEIEDKIVGEYFSEIKFWGANDLINAEIKLEKGDKKIEIRTKIYNRN